MYLFQEKDEIHITVTCKLCLRKLGIRVSRKEYDSTEEFPIKKEIVHGENPHKLSVYLDRNLEITDFEISEVSDREDISYSKELAKEVLSEMELSEEEIELYFLSTGRDVISIGEMALLIDKTKTECQEIAKKFVKKGLYKEIIGVTPHYTPIPPYAALIKQLTNFHNYIDDVKETAPSQLEESFSKLESQAKGVRKLNEYVDYIKEMREKMLSKISEQEKVINNALEKILRIENITSDFRKLENSTENLVDEQMDDLKGEFSTMNQEISGKMESQFQQLETQFDQITTEISNILEGQINSLEGDYQIIKDRVKSNLSKLHLGIVQKTVEKVIDKVFKDWLEEIRGNLSKELSNIKKSLNQGLNETTNRLNEQLIEIKNVSEKSLENTTERFNKNFLNQLRDSIREMGSNVQVVTSETIKSGENVKEIFTDTSESFNDLVVQAEERVEGISDNILQSFGNLKQTFSNRVINTLNNVLRNITEKLEISEITTRQFWEQAKQVSVYTMKDIWFIRSIESIKAHINEELIRAKMRVLIVTPEITDIDPAALKESSKHVNIRIASSIDTSLEEHNKILDQLDDMHNVSYRNRELKNIWGMNRDNEEVILCVVSKTEVAGKDKIEIGGIGSVIEEDIKIFVPILEDAWVSAQKLVPRVRKEKPRKEKVEPKPSKVESEIKQREIKETEEKEVKREIPQPKEASELEDDKKSKSILNLLENHERKASSQNVEEKESQKATQETEIVEAKPQKESEKLNLDMIKELNSVEDIKDYLNLIEAKLKTLSGSDISKMLENLLNGISEIIGYSRVLDTIKKSSQELSSIPTNLSEKQRSDFSKRIQFWKKKLNL